MRIRIVVRLICAVVVASSLVYDIWFIDWASHSTWGRTEFVDCYDYERDVCDEHSVGAIAFDFELREVNPDQLRALKQYEMAGLAFVIVAWGLVAFLAWAALRPGFRGIGYGLLVLSAGLWVAILVLRTSDPLREAVGLIGKASIYPAMWAAMLAAVVGVCSCVVHRASDRQQS